MVTDNDIEKALKQHLQSEGKELPLYIDDHESMRRRLKSVLKI